MAQGDRPDASCEVRVSMDIADLVLRVEEVGEAGDVGETGDVGVLC